MSKHHAEDYHYIGLDVHKKVVVYCIKKADGEVVEKGKIDSRAADLRDWASKLTKPWIGGMEATMFTGWIYDELNLHAAEMKVGNPMKLEAISTSKKKSDSIDASTLSDLLRANLFPEVYMGPTEMRELKSLLRYRNLLVRESTRFKNRLACRLMESGIEYDSRRLHNKGYFAELMAELREIPESVKLMLEMCRSEIEIFRTAQMRIERILMDDAKIQTRAEYLMSIPGVGVKMALTWICEVGDISRFSSRKKLISYCGLCGRLVESAGIQKRTPLSKQRNKYLQSMLIEIAKLAPRYNRELAHLHATQIAKGKNRNEATIAVARKIVGFMYAVDKGQRKFVVKEEEKEEKKRVLKVKRKKINESD